MKKGLIGLTMAMVMAITSFTGCGSSKSTTVTGPSNQAPATTSSGKESIEIAVVCTSLTGSLATNGDYMMAGVNLALEEVNAAGGINGKTLKATFLDDQVKSSEAINAVKKAVDQMKVPVIIGNDSSGLVLADMPFAAEAGIPQIVSGTNIRITNQGIKTIFRMRANDAIAAKILGEYVVKSDKHKKIAFMYTNEDYGKGFMESTDIIVKGLGAQVVDSETCNIGDTDFTAQILKIKASGADSLLLLGKEVETAKFLRQSKQLGLNIATYGGSPFSLDYVLNLAGADSFEGLKIVTHYLPQDSDPVVSAFVKKYEAKFKIQPSTHSVCYYDAVKLVAEVMKKYGTTKENIAKGLHEIGYTGVQSKYKADANGDMVTKQVIGEYKNGKWSVIDRIE